MLIVQIAVGFLIQLLLISNAYANSSTRCYDSGYGVQCDTTETPQPSSPFRGLRQGLERFIERRDAQRLANAQTAYYQQMSDNSPKVDLQAYLELKQDRDDLLNQIDGMKEELRQCSEKSRKGDK